MKTVEEFCESVFYGGFGFASYGGRLGGSDFYAAFALESDGAFSMR
ncbi:hypothetical protein [Pseudomonas sp. WS 5146]|nr:hypothetical protein [Pseudomonas sp. WS 5146]NMX59910.1 hypothetical protein [Pseudomonas sp. WS 5146]